MYNCTDKIKAITTRFSKACPTSQLDSFFFFYSTNKLTLNNSTYTTCILHLFIWSKRTKAINILAIQKSCVALDGSATSDLIQRIFVLVSCLKKVHPAQRAPKLKVWVRHLKLGERHLKLERCHHPPPPEKEQQFNIYLYIKMLYISPKLLQCKEMIISTQPYRF